MDKDKTPSELRLDEDLPVEDESAEQVAAGISNRPVRKPTPQPHRKLEPLNNSCAFGRSG